MGQIGIEYDDALPDRLEETPWLTPRMAVASGPSDAGIILLR